MSKRPTIKGKSMSQELANRGGFKDPKARAMFVGRAEYKKRPPLESKEPPRGIGQLP